jgi:hypothetical protein|tara:strand:- start:1377 stop:1526 length:150 start_codon:yes stop_codon:yes gene_type:complete
MTKNFKLSRTLSITIMFEIVPLLALGIGWDKGLLIAMPFLIIQFKTNKK